jgi:hypothetical protein
VRARSVVLSLVLPMLLAGCNDAAMDGALVDASWPLAAGDYAEVNLVLEEGDSVLASFEASGVLTWNLHSHGGTGVVDHASGSDASGEVPFTAPEPGAYSYFWVNEGDETITLDVVVTGDGELHSTFPPT